MSLIKEVNEKRDKHLSDYMEANPCKSSSRQSKATKGGTLIEDVVKDYLLNNKNVVRVETQVFANEIDEFSNIDLVAHLSNGEVVYIPCVKDLWTGTQQQDRLQLIYYKHKLLWQTEKALPQNVHVCYLCSEDYNDYLNQKTRKHARRKPKLQQTVKYLADSNILHNIDTLMSYINKLGTK